jgi:hypothetical protein
MQILKLIALVLLEFARKVWLLPHTIGDALRRRRGQAGRDALEVERIDRIRNPSKYLNEVNGTRPE